MSHLLELLGRGLDSDISEILDRYFWSVSTAADTDDIDPTDDQSLDCSDAQLQLGLAHLRLGELDQAVEHLKNTCTQSPDLLVAHLGLASAYSDMGLIEEALDQLEIANQNQPGELEILFSIGFCYEKLGQLEKAVEYYQDVIVSDGSFISARERLAAVAITSQDHEIAINQYRSISELQPYRTQIHSALGHLYYQQGEYRHAVDAYETAIALEPDNWSLIDDEVEALIGDGQIRNAIDRLHQLLEQDGNFADLHVRLGDLYSQVGDDAAAMQHYHDALELQPDYLEAFVKLGTHHLISGRWDQAAETFYEATEINDKMILSYIGLGVSQLSAGNQDQALKSFELAGSIEPNSSLLLTEMARLQLKAAVADEFLKNFAVHPDEPVSDISLDNDDLLQKQIDRHAHEIELHPDHIDLRYRYGVLLKAQDRIGEAMEQFEKAVEINPSYIQAQVKLGITQQELGLIDEAIETFKNVLEIKPDYVDMHYRLGLLYTDRNQFAFAVEEMEQASEGAPDNDQIRSGLAICLQNMGLMDKAAATWRSLWKIHRAAA